MISIGLPKRAIEVAVNFFAMFEADVSRNGIASGQRVKRSTMVNKCVYPFDDGKGPTKSMFT